MKWNQNTDSRDDSAGQGKWTRKERLERMGLSAPSSSPSRKKSSRSSTTTTWLGESTVDPSTGHRHDRLQHILLEELRCILRDEVRDRVLTDVDLRSVELSVDYKMARVKFTLPVETPSVATTVEALSRAEPFFRSRLTDSLEIKRLPSLRFVFEPRSETDDAPPSR